ncbi:hypothetical protein LCGC14_0997310 [marine sediment metagenome]|uniref:RNA polymerase sigma-70 region 4 domain-containing protein n=1 Tax=marine sediment metagenome TaxID=412755 RepID=A0A0F9N8R5_9ZZZZ|nr:hypothetical protein [Methylophaga sp.]HEC58917.1 hypothetical protein [Methylophaga sp.]
MTKIPSFIELKSILSTLTEKEARVIIARFGLKDRKAQTLELVGKSFGVTRERISQIEAKALPKLWTKALHLKAKPEDYLD